jgi:dihydroneopterin aldolase
VCSSSSSSSVTARAAAADNAAAANRIAQQRWRIAASAASAAPGQQVRPLTTTSATAKSSSIPATPAASTKPTSLDLARADSIHLRGLEFFGRHGVLPEETALGQKFVVDATLYLAPSGLAAAGESDDVADTIDYARVYARIKEVMEDGPPFKLVEAAAATLCRRVLEEHPKVAAVRVAVYKPHVALRGPLQTVGVELFRERTKRQRRARRQAQ